jgi:REP-associated tyrosine transposase
MFIAAARRAVISSIGSVMLTFAHGQYLHADISALIAIYCMPDHTHVLLGVKPNIAPSDLIGDMKTGSTNHINEQRWLGCRFSWQEGYGAFSVSHSHLDRVANYILNQETHHRRKSFQKEYVEFLERHRVPYDQRYIFKPIE